MRKIIIFGGTGFIGFNLAKTLSQKGYTPILVARNKPDKKIPFQFLPWNAYELDNWKEALNDAFAVINLAGKSVDCIKTPDNCDVILRSRVDSTKLIGKALRIVPKPPKIWIQMSTAHIYGDSPTQICTEDSATGYGLAPFVGKAWETTFWESKPNNCRGIVLRTSFVLGKNGGALQDLKRIVKLGLGGKVGNGIQGISWIHQTDLNQIFLKALTNEQYNGVYNTTAPNPVSNKLFMKTLRKVIKMPIGLSAPKFLIKIGAKHVFKTDAELALYGRYVIPEKLQKIDFDFQFPDLEIALNDLLK